MVQPPLDHHYVVMHLGGDKRVTRRNDGAPLSVIAQCGSLTLVPAGTAYVWRTEGPIAFAHLYLPPGQFAAAATRELDIDGDRVSLVERVGCRDPLIEPLFARMLEELCAGEDAATLLLDALLESFVLRLLRSHTSAHSARHGHAVALAPYRLRRALDYIEANLGRDVSLADIVDAAGTSQFHFSRAFRLATGVSPYRYLLDRRLECARVHLLTGKLPVEWIATLCGFNNRRQFSTMFRRSIGVSPLQFRALQNRYRAAAETAAPADDRAL